MEARMAGQWEIARSKLVQQLPEPNATYRPGLSCIVVQYWGLEEPIADVR